MSTTAVASAPKLGIRRPKTNGHAPAAHSDYMWERLPSELREQGSFVLYRNTNGRKVPFCPANPAQPASSADPATWATFELTRAAFQSYPGFDGINAVCSPEFTFVDLDDCVTGTQVRQDAREIMQSLPATYWELSPSGTGLHGVFHSTSRVYIPKRQGCVLEAYSEKHFMSCTGWTINDAPIGLLETKDIERFRAKKPANTVASRRDGETEIAVGQRTNTLLSIAGGMRRRGLSLESIEQAIRQHNAQCCQPPLDDKKIQGILKSVDKYKAAGSLLVQERKDVGNADRLLLYGQGDFRYIAAFNRWAVYDGARWPVEDREQEVIRARAHEMVRAFAMQAVEATDEKAIKFAADSLNSSRITNLLREAQPHATLSIAEMDHDPLLVNFRNGTLDARTMKLRPHRREDYITAVIPHDYNPKARCPRWEKFINTTFGGDKPLIDFVQSALGYSLTADTSAKCIFLAYGPTDTGKTTMLATLHRLLGDYAGRIKVESLMVERGKTLDNNAQADLADLRGRRFVMTSETGQGQLLREALVKLLSQGQGDYKAVRKYENPFSFPETWKIWMDCNHLPRVRDTDESIWNRLLVLPFNYTVAKAQQDSKLGDQLLGDEAEGILAWMAVGLRRWAEKGIQPPDCMKAQREEWKAESDTLGQWLKEECVLRSEARTESMTLYERYKQWRIRHGLYDESMVVFARNMKERGFQKKNFGAGETPNWLGVGIIARPDRP